MMQEIIWQILKGKSIVRALFNLNLKDIHVRGLTVDLGSGRKSPSYYDFLRFENRKKIFTVNVVKEILPHVLANLESSFPFRDKSIDSILAFNLLEHLYRFDFFLKECYRILRREGSLYLFVPFLVKVHPDPNDYFRYTSQSLEIALTQAGFKNLKIKEIGFGPFTAACSQIDGLFIMGLLTRIILMPLLLLAILFDTILNRVSKRYYNYKNYPLGYLVECRKD